MKRRIFVSALAVLAFAGLVESQSVSSIAQAILTRSQNTSRLVGTVATHTTLVTKYIGDNTSGGTVAVDAGTGDLTFKEGPVGSSAADDSLECPVSGALGGVIDVSNAACDTLGEVVDIINASANWRAIIVDGLRTDSSNDTLVTISETAANAADGLALLGDTGVSFDTIIAPLPTKLRGIAAYLGPREQGSKMIENPLAGQKEVFSKVYLLSNYDSGTSTGEIFCVKQRLRTPASTAGSETVRQIFSQVLAASDTANSFDFGDVGIACDEDEKLVVKLNNSADQDTVTAYVLSYQYSVR